MKETENFKKDKLEARIEIPAKTQIKYLGSLKPKKGHRLFKLDQKTGIISIAVFDEAVVELNGRIRKKLVVEPACSYTSALNSKNAVKHFNRMFKSAQSL